MRIRAYTYIDRSVARVGNQWVERSWAAFDGRTASLAVKPAQFDWITGKSTEFRIQTSTGAFGIPELSHIEWSEENSPEGATLILKRTGDTMQLTTRSFVYHELPAMLRSHTLINLSREVIVVERMTTDSLAIDQPGVRVRTDLFEKTSESKVWETEERAAAIEYQTMGFFIGQEKGGRYELFDPDPGSCSVLAPASFTLGPGDILHLPRLYIVFYGGPWQEASRTVFAEVLADLRKAG